jgi:hypothetical protein
VSYLLPYYDAELAVGEESAREIVAAERERLSHALALVQSAQRMPRRLGPEATGEDLALDKRRAKRVAWALARVLEGWGGPVRGHWDVQAAAAQLKWDSWWGEQEVLITNRMRYVATWGIKRNNEKWAKTAIVKFNNELRWVSYAMR